MRVKINMRYFEVEDDATVEKLIDLSGYKSESDLVFIKNSFVSNENSSIKEDDNIFIIPKNEKIKEEDLENFILARNSIDVVRKLGERKVAILGLGGLGSNIAMSLARTGVKNIELFDFDIVEPSNINRQNYFIDQIGMKKTFATIENIKRVNPYISVVGHDIYLNEDNYDEYLKDVDIVVEAFDNPKCKAELMGYFIKNYQEKYLVASSGMAGYYPSNIIKTNRIRNKIYLCGDGINSAKEFDGLMSPRVSIVAGHQANCVIRILMDVMEVE